MGTPATRLSLVDCATSSRRWRVLAGRTLVVVATIAGIVSCGDPDPDAEFAQGAQALGGVGYGDECEMDVCGVCGGDGSTCIGCDGQPNSRMVVDACGVCGGDGSSCCSCATGCGPCTATCGDRVCTDGESCRTCAADCGSCTAACGDGTCTGDESCATCADDCNSCTATCGDGACTDDESCATCADDCGSCTAACGDGTCTNDESCVTCADDCDVCAATCGDEVCAPGETCDVCADDCGTCTTTCGDGVCGVDETCADCAGDCGVCSGACGDGQCDDEEHCESCADDCGTCTVTCGDGVCAAGESCASCADDCNTCTTACGDGVCAPDESCALCAADCGTCPWPCGDGVCGADESCASCAADCGACPSPCGDGVCGEDESCASCAVDCGACPSPCGDSVCGEDESCASCAVDCGACPWPCGDSVCGEDESCASCATDCGACPPPCGDGVCGADESCASCADDCGTCTVTCGDGTCTDDEGCETCADDCGACTVTCGDGACTSDESCRRCAADCGTCAATCGDGTCNAGETCRSCRADCGPCACRQPAPPPPPPPPPPPAVLATVTGATARSPVYVVQNHDDWLVQALAIITNSSPGTSSTGMAVPNVIDITSLGCFSERNAAAFAPAIARRIFDNLRIDPQTLAIRRSANPVHIRMAFAQRDSATGLNANFNYTARCLTNPNAFLALLHRHLRGLLIANFPNMNADAWMSQNRDALMNSDTPEFSINISWVAWGEGTIAEDNWNHSKIITNGVAALVGGSNLYDEYRQPENPAVQDTDLVVWGAAAAAARAWNNTLWRDYAGRAGTGVYYRVRLVRRGNEFAIDNRTTALTSANNNSGYPFFVQSPTVTMAAPAPAGQRDHVAATVLTYAGGVKGVEFTDSPHNQPNTVAVVNAYDQAIGNMLTAAIRRDRVVIRVAQQDFANSSVGTDQPEHAMSYVPTGTGACRAKNIGDIGVTSDCSSIHRAALIDLLVHAVAVLPSHALTTRVKLLKSEGAGYRLEAPMQHQMAGLKERVINLSMVRLPPGGDAANRDRVKHARGVQFNDVVVAKGTGGQRLHSKFVSVDLADQDQVAASVGSLNLYNARMMHDFGNIIVGRPTDRAQVELREQFDTRFAKAPNTVVADARMYHRCHPTMNVETVVASLADPATPFGAQVDLALGLVWSGFSPSAQPGLQIEPYGANTFAEVAVSLDCDGNVVLSEEDGVDGWNYNPSGMTTRRASMPPPPAGTMCSLRLVSDASVITASLTCGVRTISVPIRSLPAASAYRVTPETAVGTIRYMTGTCFNVGAIDYPVSP